MVDDETVASVKRNETKEVTVGAGRHQVWMRISRYSRYRSQSLDIDVQGGDKIRLVCGGNVPPGQALRYATTLPSRWIDLQLDT